jgi:hypothetical protein
VQHRRVCLRSAQLTTNHKCFVYSICRLDENETTISLFANCLAITGHSGGDLFRPSTKMHVECADAYHALRFVEIQDFEISSIS